MSFVTFEVNSDKFKEELQESKNKFSSMVNTMKSIALLIEQNTIEYVPLDTSALEQSYEASKPIVVGNSIYMSVGYDAVDKGFHYAEYQHNVITTSQHPKRGVQFYLRRGITDSKGEIFQMIERDYLSLFTGGTVTSSTMGEITGDKIRLIRRII